PHSRTRRYEAPLPAIAHWRGSDWVVLYAVNDGHVRSADPALGLRKIPRDEFTEKWSGYASLLAPTERLAEAPEARTSLAWLVPFVRPHLRKIGLAVLLAAAAAALQLVLPIMTQVVGARVLPPPDLNLVYVVLAAIAGVTIAMTGATLVQRYLLSSVAVRFDV